MSALVRIYYSEGCPFCLQAERLLNKRGATLEKIHVDLESSELDAMVQSTGRDTVPQIFIGERHIGGYDDLVDLDMDGELMPLLQN